MIEFPTELVDTVIDLLQSDGPALIACSRVSRQWLPRSRHHRFRSLSLFVDWDSKDPATSHKVERLLALLFSPLVTFVKCVKEVKLTHKWNTSFEGQAMSPREILSELACCGIRPTHLYLDCYRLFKLPPEGPPAFASSLIHLEIQLENNHVALDSLVPYICAFPQLESLRIRGLPDDIDEYMKPGISLALPPRLHTLHIAHPLLSDWIISLDPVPKQITTLGLLHIHWNDWPGINRYLESAAAQSVQSLIFNYGGRLRRNGPGPEFKYLRRVKHLSLYKLHTEGPKSLLGVLARLKISPARRTLETITLSLRFTPGAERYSPAKWHALDAELADTAVWPSLRSFTILADTDTHTDPDSDDGKRKDKTLERTLAELSISAHIDIPIALSIRANLGQCDDLGILKIEGIPMVHPHEVPLRVEQGLSSSLSVSRANVGSTLSRQEITAWMAGITG